MIATVVTVAIEETVLSTVALAAVGTAVGRFATFMPARRHPRHASVAHPNAEAERPPQRVPGEPLQAGAKAEIVQAVAPVEPADSTGARESVWLPCEIRQQAAEKWGQQVDYARSAGNRRTSERRLEALGAFAAVAVDAVEDEYRRGQQ